MSFTDAIRSVLQQNYANFHGRARRSEYWYWFLALVIVEVVIRIIGLVSGGLYDVLAVLLFLGLIVPNLAVGSRRLHDTGRTGWWQLIGIIPLIGWIVLVVFFVTDSQPASNQYGDSPKAAFQPGTA